MKEKKEKKTRKLHPMSEENSRLLDSIEDHIKRQLTSSLTSDGYKTINDKVDDTLYIIFQEIDAILKTHNSWDDISNLSKIYHSYASMRFLLSSFVPLIYSYLQKDESAMYLFQSIATATGKHYIKSLSIVGENDVSELKNVISFIPFLSFLIDNVDCENSGGGNILCRITARYANKPLLEIISQILGDILSELKVSLSKVQVSENGQFAILTLKVNQ
ncbi:hypothetical protein SJAV_12360 [Sulfurisphaera javensis]|uniref:Uncharacterized protein n=1 Tax=Sulfurisphaera javensis TaxID=2049879 RepID=A0AAT9GR16_9CREN